MKQLTFAALLALFASPVFAQVAVNDPWVRATVPQQKATGAFMQITSQQDARLIEVRSSAAGVAEIHEMTMENNVMKMRPVPGIDLPAGKTVTLDSNGYHVMLMNLKQQVKENDIVPLTLVIENKDKKRELVDLKAPARALNSMHMENHHSR